MEKTERKEVALEENRNGTAYHAGGLLLEIHVFVIVLC